MIIKASILMWQKGLTNSILRSKNDQIFRYINYYFTIKCIFYSNINCNKWFIVNIDNFEIHWFSKVKNFIYLNSQIWLISYHDKVMFALYLKNYITQIFR